MRFEILGPLRVSAGSVTVTVTARREQVVLAMLLLQAGEYVPVERLVDAVWADKPPRNAVSQIHGTVYRLRRQLAAVGVPDPVVTESGGYRTRVDPLSVDLWQFRRLLKEARAAAARGEHESAAHQYRAALQLWRGPAMAGIKSAETQRSAAALGDERIQARQEWIEVELSLGSAGELVAELTGLVQQHPYREGLHAALMRALYLAGRHADALAAYRHTRQLLHDELGTEPGAELQRLHKAILNRDPALDIPGTPTGSPQPASGMPSIPRELPADVAGFTGRTDALAALDHMLPGGAAGTAGPIVISAIAGMAGVGKSALAVHWAHRSTDRFPDGQLYVNLRGYDPDQPMTPAEALARLLSALGVAGQDIPLDLDDRATRYRSKAGGRRMLMVLDNAATVEQVRPLLPGSGSCAVVVTSRDSLAGLVSLHGAHRLDLDLLSPAEAITLLRCLIGNRVDAEPDAAAELARQCARLPLALRVAAELAVSRPTLPLAKLVVELADQQRRLDLLDAGGDPHAAVKVVFSWSIQHLSPEAARAFRLLGLHPGPDSEPYAAAAMAGTSLEQARRTLDLLARAHLVHPVSPGRYGMHDLLRAYATHLTTAEDTDQQRRAARDRLFDYYLVTAAAAMDSLHPAEAHRRPRIPPPATPTPDLADPDTARAWLDTERSCLVAAAAHTAAHGRPTHTIGLASILFRYLDGGHYSDGLAIHGHAHHAAQQTGNLAEQAHALRRLGTIHDRMGRMAPAADHLHRALTLFRQAGDQTGEAIALTSLGGVERRLGRYQPAIDHLQQALTLFRQVGDRTGEASALTSLGVVERRLGRYASAADRLQQAVALSRRAGDQTDEAIALNNLGNVEQNLGRYASATDHHQQAIALFQKLGHRQGEASAMDNLGTVHIRLGQPGQATEHFEQALALLREIGDQEGEAWALNGLGEAAHTAGRRSDALAHHTEALALATEVGSRDQQARAHAGVGNAHHTLGDLTRARTHYEQALTVYTDLDMPDAEDVRAHLATLDQEQERPPVGLNGPAPDLAQAP